MNRPARHMVFMLDDQDAIDLFAMAREARCTSTKKAKTLLVAAIHQYREDVAAGTRPPAEDWRREPIDHGHGCSTCGWGPSCKSHNFYAGSQCKMWKESAS